MILDPDLEFASILLKAGTRNSDNCGTNGLPVTPCSITLIGNFKSLIEPVNHDHLVQFVDCFRNKHEKVSLVFQHCTSQDKSQIKFNVAIKHLLAGLYELHHVLNFVHGNITPNCVQKAAGNIYRLNFWPLNVLTDNGSLLDSESLLPDDIRFLAPERVSNVTMAPIRKSDIWSLALTMLSLQFPNEINLPSNPCDLARLDTSDQVLKRLQVPLDNLSPEWLSFYNLSLEPSVSRRANVKQAMACFKMDIPKVPLTMLETLIRFDKLSLNLDNPRLAMNVREAYFLLSLSTPGLKDDPEKSSSKQANVPSIKTIPCLMTLNPLPSGSTSKSSSVSSPSSPESNLPILSFVPVKVHQIQSDTFKDRLSQLDPNLFFPLLIFDPEINNQGEEREEERRNSEHGRVREETKQTRKKKKHELKREESCSSNLPLVIRENDFAYQVERTMLFKALVEGVPYVRGSLLEAAQVDINPFYRPWIWGSILNVKWSDMILYEEIDKITATSTDRQISVDIPRCHQYNDLLASPKGHQKLTRVLKAWLAHNEHHGFVYWQGLDSLASPFIIVNFDNEPLAFACFNAFIHKYLAGFFDKDNSPTIQEYLSLFSHLVAFHDPVLFNHLDELGFNPELYAIPWFLTMFTHVLPLHKSIHVWDTLLLGNEGFPLCIGLAILMQLRSQLVNFTFNDCILIFSDLPEINIDDLVKESIRIFKSTPKSVLTRQWVPLIELRAEICPQISIQDLVDLKNPAGGFKSKVVIIDMRSGEFLAAYGSIKGAIVGFGGKSCVKEVIPTSYNLLVIVNDVQLGTDLVRDNVIRVCNLICNDFIPKELTE